jgi:hypothetical protein
VIRQSVGSRDHRVRWDGATDGATGPVSGRRPVGGWRWAAPEQCVWRRVAAARFCFHDSSPERHGRIGMGGKKGVGYEISSHRSPSRFVG